MLTAVLALAACGDDGAVVEPTSGAGVERIAYGSTPEQFGDLYLPAAASAPPPVIVLLHGGFWRSQFTLELMEALGEDLAERGYAAFNVEYRGVGQPGGGYPGTLEDVASALDHVAELAKTRALDVERVAVLGHSAGGHLALWAGQRERLPTGAPGSAPAVSPKVVIGLAPVPDLIAAHERGVGGTAVSDLMGGPPVSREAEYAIASPAALLPIAADQVIVHGRLDTIVPVSLSSDYAQLAGAEPLTLLTIDGADHFDVIDPTQAAWTAVLDALAESLGPR